MKFTVVGIYDRTYMTVTDSAAFVPLADAQQIFYRRLPDAFRAQREPLRARAAGQRLRR